MTAKFCFIKGSLAIVIHYHSPALHIFKDETANFWVSRFVRPSVVAYLRSGLADSSPAQAQ